MSDDAQAQLSTLQANNQADATALTAFEADLSTPATESTGDQVLAAVVPVVTTAGLVAVFGADALVTALTDEGYGVTTTVAETESVGEDATDTTSDPTNPTA